MEKKSDWKKLLLWVVAGAAIGLGAMLIINNTINPVIVSGVSMEPTYSDGDVVFGSTDLSKITYGDILVMYPNTAVPAKVIKRVVALPGDTVWVKDGILYLNGRESPYQYEKINSAGQIATPYIIPADSYFCMGDNRNHSEDSRDYGPVHISRIKYKVK